MKLTLSDILIESNSTEEYEKGLGMLSYKGGIGKFEDKQKIEQCLKKYVLLSNNQKVLKKVRQVKETKYSFKP